MTKFKVGDKVCFKNDPTDKVYFVDGVDCNDSNEICHLYMIDHYRHWFFDYELELVNND